MRKPTDPSCGFSSLPEPWPSPLAVPLLWLTRCVPPGVDSSPASSGLATLQSAWHAIEAMTDLYEQCTAARTLRLDTMVAVRGDIDKLEDEVPEEDWTLSSCERLLWLPPVLAARADGRVLAQTARCCSWTRIRCRGSNYKSGGRGQEVGLARGVCIQKFLAC